MAESFGAADMSWRDTLINKVGVSYHYHQEVVTKGHFNYSNTILHPYIFMLKLVAGALLRISAAISRKLTPWIFLASSYRHQRTEDKEVAI